MTYPWYESVESDTLRQGDIFRDYPIFSPDVTPADVQAVLQGSSPSVAVGIELLDVIVVTQSCDLAHEKVTSALLCPIWPLSKIEEKLGQNRKERQKRKESIRKGEEHTFHMLNSDAKVDVPLSVVEFRRIFTTPKDVLASFAQGCGPRIRLLPPYREHLSQAFARYFMRVGLPVDIPQFT